MALLDFFLPKREPARWLGPRRTNHHSIEDAVETMSRLLDVSYSDLIITSDQLRQANVVGSDVNREKRGGAAETSADSRGARQNVAVVDVGSGLGAADDLLRSQVNDMACFSPPIRLLVLQS